MWLVCCLLQIDLDFAAMQRDNPKLLTLKDFVMSSNQAPESPSDILHLLQAFADFKQGTGTSLYGDCIVYRETCPHM